MRKIIALMMVAFAGQWVNAEFSAGLGYFSHNVNKVTTTGDAEKSLLGTTYVPIVTRYQTMPFWGSISWAPYLSFTHLTTLIVKSETPDGTAKRNFAILGSPLIYPVSESWFVSGGPGFMYYELKGKGGKKTVNNGTGTAEFGVPSQTRSSKMFVFELGTGFNLPSWRMDFDLLFTGLASDRLATSFQASLTFKFGGATW